MHEHEREKLKKELEGKNRGYIFARIGIERNKIRESTDKIEYMLYFLEHVTK